MTEWSCPDGHVLNGVLQSLRGVAQGVPTREDGKVVLEPGGYTEVFWDETSDITRDGEQLWLCYEGDTWKASELIELVEIGEDEP